MQTKTKKQLTLLLAALTLAAPQFGALSPSLQNTPLGVQTAQAQNRRGRDSSNKYKRETVRGTVAGDLRGDRFLIRINDKYYTVVARNGESDNIRKGREVEATGYWKDGAFYADSVQVIRNNNNGNNNWNERRLQGQVVRNKENRRYSLRVDDGRTIDFESNDDNSGRVSVGDTVIIEGRWDRNDRDNRHDDVFKADKVRVVSNSGDRNERTIRGVVLSDNDNRRFTIRTSDRRDITVVNDERNPRRLSRGDTVEVEGRWDRNQRGNSRDDVFRASSVRILRNR